MRAKKVDSNQADIVRTLRSIPSVSVEVDCDDILVGFRGQTYWFEIKSPLAVSKVTGEVLENRLEPNQKRLLREWRGHYSVCWNIEQILDELGIG